MNLVINDFVGDAAYGHFGEQAPLQKSFNWLTDLVSFDSGKEQRNQILEQPIREWPVNWQWMDKASRNKLIELFQRARGRYITFLYSDEEDYECALTECSIIAIADQTNFQLIKSYYIGETETWDEVRKDIVAGSIFPPVVEVNGAPKIEGVDYTLDDTTGIIIFGAAPGVDKIITANYRFYFRVRFAGDIHNDVEHQKGFYSYEDLRLIEVLN